MKEKKYYNVTFKWSDGIYCTNIAHASCVADVEKRYSEYEWVDVRELQDYELSEKRSKGTPVIEV